MQMDEIKKALLLGLKSFGRNKTFNEILVEAGFKIDKIQRIELANELEAEGLIHTVTYRLPFEIRAELTPNGKKSLGDNGGNDIVQSILLLLGLTNQGWAVI
jgi:hypothetical protein